MTHPCPFGSAAPRGRGVRDVEIEPHAGEFARIKSDPVCLRPVNAAAEEWPSKGAIMHSIKNNITLGFIEVTVEGLWDEPHFDRFAADLRAAILAFPNTGRPPMTLYNYTRASIQTQAIVAKMRALAHHPSMLDRKVAMYTEGCLARQQAKRVAGDRHNMRVFDSRDSALAFLADDSAGNAPAAVPDLRTPRSAVG